MLTLSTDWVFFACCLYHLTPVAVDQPLRFTHSFFCNVGTEFDQRLLTCVHESPNRSPCAGARQFYESSNSQFFRDVGFNADAAPPVPTQSVNPPTGDGQVVLIGVTGGVPVDAIQSVQGPEEAQGLVSDFVTGGGLDAIQTGGQVQPVSGPEEAQGLVNDFVTGGGVNTIQSGGQVQQGAGPVEDPLIELLTGGSVDELNTDGAGLIDLRIGLPNL